MWKSQLYFSEYIPYGASRKSTASEVQKRRSFKLSPARGVYFEPYVGEPKVPRNLFEKEKGSLSRMRESRQLLRQRRESGVVSRRGLTHQNTGHSRNRPNRVFSEATPVHPTTQTTMTSTVTSQVDVVLQSRKLDDLRHRRPSSAWSAQRKLLQ